MKRRGLRTKKAVSPVIATTLLIGMVIVLGVIVFVWLRALSQDAITKFDNQNIELVCQDITTEDLDVDYSTSEEKLYISNNGNVPIYDFQIRKITDSGDYNTGKASDISTWPPYGLNAGKAFSGVLDVSSDVKEIILIPILLGNSDEGEKTFICDESVGKEITL